MSDDGSAFIGYAAKLRWKRMSFTYSSILHTQAGKDVEIDTTLRECNSPEISESSTCWSSSRLNVVGNWKAIAQPIRRTLLSSPAGNIEWNCLHPQATAVLRIGSDRRIEGLGYVEKLTVTIPPWKLPFDELRWGRFLSNNDALVWIFWRGDTELNLVLHNGIQLENGLVSDNGIEATDLDFTLGKNKVLREGPLFKTALSMTPRIEGLMPFRMLRMFEGKWLSPGVLKKPHAEPGWAIHEVVRWRKNHG